MNVNKLQTFLTLSECLNFTEAAERLYCSQPSVSMQIQSMEDDLGVPLFDRIGKKLYLTKQGEHFKPYAEQIINLLASAKDHIRQLEDLSFGTLSIGASNFVGVYLLPRMLREYTTSFPNIKINMNITSSNHLIHMLETNKVDLLILSDRVRIDETRYQRTTFYQDELVLIVNPEHKLAKQKTCTLADLTNETFILKPNKSATRVYLEDQFQEHGFTPPHYMEISNLEGIKQGVIHNLGVSIVSNFAIQQELKHGLLVKVPIQGIQFLRGISYVYPRNKHFSPAANKFLPLLDQANL
ncbi:LysR family transcriptional regulator [Paenibacillus marchantiophytorum]|uniref:LysR family transcriptional regulator n=1 Tax=Paenibacillus marchantiophytorum TaxID=1619310 RepID=A0ABQ2BSS7_9BACL|nr:LysR family transcriptional regulator [Paenibacillus marchantiophytorum]GGI46803.1 LysR family transcriptional regulator [Paenibacillus marchantiophytorum]